jgi:hypothetical protein
MAQETRILLFSKMKSCCMKVLRKSENKTKVPREKDYNQRFSAFEQLTLSATKALKTVYVGK